MTDQNNKYSDKKAFVYECAIKALQGSFSNPTAQSSIASIVRSCDKLWDELQEWEATQTPQNNSK